MKKYFFLILIINGLVVFFLTTNINNHKEFVVKKGTNYFPEGIMADYIIIEPGAELVMGQNSKIITKQIIAKGGENSKIFFRAKNGEYWRGIEVVDSNSCDNKIEYYLKSFLEKKMIESGFFLEFNSGSIFNNCVFSDLATNFRRDVANRKKAVIEVEDTSLQVLNSKFENIVHMGSIQSISSIIHISGNIFSSRLTMKILHLIDSINFVHDNEFIPQRNEYQTWPDGIFTNGGFGIVANNKFDGLSDDAIDFDNSFAFVSNNVINNTYDDGIDIDNKTEAYIIGNNINNILEDGVLVSNQSRVLLLDNYIKNSKNAIVLRSGARIETSENLLENSKVDFFAYSAIPLLFNDSEFKEAKRRFRNLSIVDFKNIGIYEVEDINNFISFLDHSYKSVDGYRILDDKIDLSDNLFEDFLFLKKAFKLINVLDFQTNLEEEIKQIDEKERQRLLKKYTNVIILSHQKELKDFSIKNFLYPYCISTKEFANVCSQGEDGDMLIQQKDINEYLEYINKLRVEVVYK